MYRRSIGGLLVAAVVTAGPLLFSNLTAAQETITIETGKVRGAATKGVVSKWW